MYMFLFFFFPAFIVILYFSLLPFFLSYYPERNPPHSVYMITLAVHGIFKPLLLSECATHT